MSLSKRPVRSDSFCPIIASSTRWWSRPERLAPRRGSLFPETTMNSLSEGILRFAGALLAAVIFALAVAFMLHANGCL